MARVERAGLQRAMAYTNARVGVVEGENQQYTEEQLRRFGPGAYLGLVRNGAGITGNNDNFTGATFVGDSLVAGGGSFEFVGGGFGDDYIAVDPARPLRLSFYARNVEGDPGLFFSAVVAHDVDRQPINAAHWMYQPGTLTTLTQPLRRGDVVAHVASTAGWNPVGAGEHLRGLTVWNQRSAAGYLYRPETYSRLTSFAGLGWYTAITETTVTLSAAWQHADQPAGAPVSNGTTGGTYTYIAASAAALTTAWALFEGRTTGLDNGAARRGDGMPPGTAFVRPYFFNTTGARVRLNMVQLSEVAQ